MKLCYKMYFAGILTLFFAGLFFGMLVSTTPAFAQNTLDTSMTSQSVTQNAKVDTSNAGVSVKVAPGEILPISVKLLNFGGGQKVDVTITYIITNSKAEEIYSASETVAVETTASFVKTIQIPFGTPPGIYTAEASILYQDQAVPATTQFSFVVEDKIFGLFKSDFLVYGGITAIISILMVILGRVLIKRKSTRLSPIDYSDVPHEKRVFFELLSDTIMQMRLRVGDTALEVATHIEGLTIDKKTGRVMKMTESPSKIIASLVAGYEKALGQKVSFFFRNPRST